MGECGTCSERSDCDYDERKEGHGCRDYCWEPEIIREIEGYRPWTVQEAMGKWVVCGDYTQMLVRFNRWDQFEFNDDKWLTTERIMFTCRNLDGSICGVRR